jgi:LysR family hca operon transcriptional activator
MELRHLRYFVAVAEEGNLSAAAEKRLHTAQPSLSRQMKDLEVELGVTLMVRNARGIELTPAGQVFLAHARVALLQVEAATEAARRAGGKSGASFALGFLTGYEMYWLSAVMAIMREKLPSIEIVVHSLQSPDLARELISGKLDAAFLRPERDAPGIVFRTLRREPLMVVMAATHTLAAKDAIAPADIAGQTLVGVPHSNSPALRAVTDQWGTKVGVDLTPHHEALNLAMAISLIASTGGIGLLPRYAGQMLPPTVVSRPILGAPPMIDLALGYNEANRSPLLKFLLSKLDDLKFRVERSHPE